MSRNGSGTYSLPAGNPVVTGTTIASSWANNTMNDIAAALTGSVAADGQTPMTGDLDMNTNKVVNLDPATVAGNAVEYAQFVSATTTNVAITGGTINGATIGVTTPASGRFTTLEATGAFTAGSTAAITGNTTVGGTLQVTNAFTAQSTADITGNVTVGGTLDVTGATDLNSTLDVTGNTTVGGTLTVTGNGSFNSTGALKIPSGTTGQQPTPTSGMIRYNSTNNDFEGYYASTWGSFGGGVGVGQTWQSVFFSRGFGVTYTNTTGKPIMVSISATVLNTSTWSAYVDGTLIIYNNGSGATSNAPVTGTFIVPNGSTYYAGYTGSLSTIAQWVELR